MANENASKSWIIYCALFAAIIVISALYVVEVFKHANSKEANNFNACNMKLRNCDLELHIVEQKYNISRLDHKVCLNEKTELNGTDVKLVLDIQKNAKREDIFPSNHQTYKYTMASATTRLNHLDYLLMWCFIMIKCFILFYYILP